MNKIKFKPENSDSFSSYIEIQKSDYNTYEDFQSQLPNYGDTRQTIQEWFGVFRKMPKGQQLDIINYFFLNNLEEYPEIYKSLYKEKVRLTKMLNQYYLDGVFIGGLDFYNLDEDDGWVIDKEISNNKDEIGEVHFRDGRIIKLINKDVTLINSRFIPYEEYEFFTKEIQFFIDLMARRIL